MKMKIAVPLDTDGQVYSMNPWTAPIFAIYSVQDREDMIIFERLEEKTNPWAQKDKGIVCDPMMCTDGCSDVIKADLNHLADHYIILEVLNGCSYLIAEIACSNLEKVLEHGGIGFYVLPPIIKKPDLAIKRLLVNLDYTDSIQKIRNISR